MLHPGDTLDHRRLCAAIRRRGASRRARTSPPTAPPSKCDATATMVEELHPQRRFFPLQQMTTSVTAIRTNLLADLYVVLGDPDDSKRLDGPRLLEAADAVDLDRRGDHGVWRRAQPQRPALARRRRVAAALARGASRAGRIDFAAFAVSAAGRAVRRRRGLFRASRCNPNRDPHVLPSAMIDKPVPAFQLAGLDGGQGIALDRAQGPGHPASISSRRGACRAATSIRC